MGFVQRWREYGDRPPVARWTARISSIVGLVIGIVLIVLAAAVVVKLLLLAIVWVAGWVMS